MKRFLTLIIFLLLLLALPALSEGNNEHPNDSEHNDDAFYGVWVATYPEKDEAEALVSRLKEKELDASYVFSPD